MKTNFKLFLFNKPISHLVNNIRIDYAEITQLREKAEIKTTVTKL